MNRSSPTSSTATQEQNKKPHASVLAATLHSPSLATFCKSMKLPKNMAIRSLVAMIAAVTASLAAAFRAFPHNALERSSHKAPLQSVSSAASASSAIWESWLWDSVAGSITGASISTEKSEMQYSVAGIPESKRSKNTTGTVIRCAARSYLKEASEPSSRQYTTRKNEFPLLSVTFAGVAGDYNHYRTKALKSTGDRALSILTHDVFESLKQQERGIREGDLGENILVRDLEYSVFKVGARYQISGHENSDHGEGKGASVIIEITEPIEPCTNLCKLRFINQNGLKPSKRIEKCRNFLKRLSVEDGLRGWYAKVLRGGMVRVGDKMTPVIIA